MKAKLLLISSFLLTISAHAQFTSLDTRPTYFMNSNQQFPVFAGNDGNWKAKATTGASLYWLDGFESVNLFSNQSSISLDGFMPKFKSAVYLNGVTDKFGQLRSTHLNAGISPRFKLGEHTKLVLNAGVIHKTFRVHPNDFQDLNFKSNYLNAEIGGAILYKSFYAAVQHHNILGSYAYLWKIEYNTFPSGREPYKSNTRLLIGKSFEVSEEWKLNFSASSIGEIGLAKQTGFVLNITSQYKWLMMAASIDSYEQFQMGVGVTIKQRLKLVYGASYDFSRISRGSANIHQIGISYNITKPNKDHQLLPLLSMF